MGLPRGERLLLRSDLCLVEGERDRFRDISCGDLRRDISSGDLRPFLIGSLYDCVRGLGLALEAWRVVRASGLFE